MIARFHMTENKMSSQANYAVDASTYVEKKSNVYIDSRIKIIIIRMRVQEHGSP